VHNRAGRFGVRVITQVAHLQVIPELGAPGT